MIDERQKLRQVISIGLEIANIKDLDLLMEMVLTEARALTGADAGSIYIIENGKLRFSHAQNETLEKKLPPGKKLIYSTFSIPISNRSIAGYVAGSGATVNITDVRLLPPGVPYSFDRQMDEVAGYESRSMLTIPLKSQRGETIGVLQLINARDLCGRTVPFSPEDEHFIQLFASSAAAALERAQMTRAIILRMISMAKLRDPKETWAHVNRVAAYAVEIYENWARGRGMQEAEIMKGKDVLRMAAMLHDVGKVAISDTILRKPARLDPQEFEVMKQHTYLGARLFQTKYSEFDEAAYVVALEHHERWDGTGYPGSIDPATGQVLAGREGRMGATAGKRGEEIHPFGRAVAVADVFDALSSPRAYKEAWSEEKVLETMCAGAGSHFDPEMVEGFFRGLEVIRTIAGRYPDNEE